MKETIVELHNRDNVIVTDTRHRISVDTEQCAHDYASLMYNHMRSDGMTVILLAVIQAIMPDTDFAERGNSDLLEAAERAIRNLA